MNPVEWLLYAAASEISAMYEVWPLDVVFAADIVRRNGWLVATYGRHR